MSARPLTSLRDWIIVGFVAIVGFACFTTGSIASARMSDEVPTLSAGRLTARALVAIVVAALMLVSERRRQGTSASTAALDGIQLAAIVIIADNLSGVPDGGTRLALRSATVLIGIPLMALVTHLFARRAGRPEA